MSLLGLVLFSGVVFGIGIPAFAAVSGRVEDRPKTMSFLFLVGVLSTVSIFVE